VKTQHDLRDFYDTNLRNELSQLEIKRKKLLNLYLQVGMGIVVALAIAAIIVFSSGFPNPVPLIIILILGGIVGHFITKGAAKEYKESFKSAIIQQIVTFIDPDLHYDMSSYIGKELYMSSELFKTRPDRYKGDDFVRGRVGATELMFSEVHSQYRTKDSKGRSSYHTIFRGMFFIADFNKHFRGKTIILPDTAEKLFGGLGKMFQSWNFSRDELIKMDDPEFEKLFVVYGTDQVEARYILSPALMQRISEFKKRTGKKIHLSFKNSCVFVAIGYTKALFEPRVFSSILDFSQIKEYYNDLALTIGIVEDLNLNTRIWTKE